MLFSAELVLEEKIEYNDLVKTIPDGNSSNEDEHNNVQTTQLDKQKDVATDTGTCIFCFIECFSSENEIFLLLV